MSHETKAAKSTDAEQPCQAPNCGKRVLDAVLIQEGNRLIAEFMGYKYFEDKVHYLGGMDNVYSKVPIDITIDDYECKWFKELPNPDFKSKLPVRWNPDFGLLSWGTLNYNEYMQGELEYHSSWDWLMPVVKKVRIIVNDRHKVTDKEAFMWCEIMDAVIDVDIEKSFLSVTKYLKWYNQNAPIV